VTIKEACDILGVGRTKLNELMKTELEVKHIGRSVKIKADSIRHYLARP
jgi:excisionase family DNA binding protein